jgi:hypothetical protein
MDSDYPFGIFKLFLQEVYAQGITNDERSVGRWIKVGFRKHAYPPKVSAF